MPKVTKNNLHACYYCDKKFKFASGLVSHSGKCRNRTRFIKKDEPISKLAYILWIESFKKSARKNFEYTAFIEHRDYNSFIKVAEFCIYINITDPIAYMNWCLENRLQTPVWVIDSNYDKYVKYLMIHEHPADAIQRSLSHVYTIFGRDLNGFFNTVKPGVLINMIEMGRISPWLIFLTPGSWVALKRFTIEQTKKYNSIVNISIWNILKNKYKDDCSNIREILEGETKNG